MKQGLTVVTWSGGKEQAINLLQSLKGCEYPILVVINDGLDVTWLDDRKDIQIIKMEKDGYELGAIWATIEYTDWDEFIILQDTIECLNIGVFKTLFNNYPNKSVAYGVNFQMFFGKFRREAVIKIPKMEISTKIEALIQERFFLAKYHNVEEVITFNPDFHDLSVGGLLEERWGRVNVVLRDDNFIKRKGTWDIEQLGSEIARQINSAPDPYI